MTQPFGQVVRLFGPLACAVCIALIISQTALAQSGDRKLPPAPDREPADAPTPFPLGQIYVPQVKFDQRRSPTSRFATTSPVSTRDQRKEFRKHRVDDIVAQVAGERLLDEEHAAAWFVEWVADAAMLQSKDERESNVAWQSPFIAVSATERAHSRLVELLRIVRNKEFHFEGAFVDVDVIAGPKEDLRRLVLSAHSTQITRAGADVESPASKARGQEGGTTVLTDAEVSELLVRARGSSQFCFTSVPHITGLNGQVINIDCGPRRTIVTGLKRDMHGWIPDESTCCEGLAMTVRPLAISGGTHLELKGEYISLGPMRTFPQSIRDGSPVQSFACPDGTTTLGFHTHADLMDGHSLCIWGFAATGKNAESQLIVVRATTSRMHP
jgi:hypothetical protein